MASAEDMQKLSKVLDIPIETLESQLSGFPDRGRSLEMPPKDPLVYRLYEVVQNYGYAYKAVLNEKFGDGIMSAISFSTKIEKETDEKGEWAKITLRGKWYVNLDTMWMLRTDNAAGCHTPASKCCTQCTSNTTTDSYCIDHIMTIVRVASLVTFVFVAARAIDDRALVACLQFHLTTLRKS